MRHESEADPSAVARASRPRPLPPRLGLQWASFQGRAKLPECGSGTLPPQRARRPRYNILPRVSRKAQGFPPLCRAPGERSLWLAALGLGAQDRCGIIAERIDDEGAVEVLASLKVFGQQVPAPSSGAAVTRSKDKKT